MDTLESSLEQAIFKWVKPISKDLQWDVEKEHQKNANSSVANLSNTQGLEKNKLNKSLASIDVQVLEALQNNPVLFQRLLNIYLDN
mgnify:CR=1 FL=1